tara:strand:+ start:2416 stop:3291 length:876 start_codon:yes stop_codon:yes gene_type:complete
MDIKLQRTQSQGCYKIRLNHVAGWEQYFLLLSDIHFDSKYCNRRLLKRHLEQAKERNAPVMIFGDLLDLMQSKQDPRGSKSTIDPRYTSSDDYLSLVCEDVASFLAPYAPNLLLLSMGNHEFEYRRRHEIDPLTIVSTLLKSNTGYGPTIAPYSGWIQFKYQSGSGNRSGHNLKWHHGVGSSAPVTRGAIQTNRFSVMFPNADIQVRGHINQRFSMYIPREIINTRGRLITDQDALHLQLGCYAQDNEDGNTWSQRRGMGTSALGGWWLRLYQEQPQKKYPRILYQAIGTD